MPTIELISVGCPAVPNLPKFATFAYEAEDTLQSHRGLFQREFDRTSGVILHLASKSLEGAENGWFGADLIAWDDEGVVIPDDEIHGSEWSGAGQMEFFRFQPAVLPDLRALMARLISTSPVSEVWFSTDIQWGPSTTTKEQTTLDGFFALHERAALRWHCLYRIVERSTDRPHAPDG